MKPGQLYNPWKMFVGSFVPNALMRCPDISSTAKLVFARLCQYAGQRGEAFPTQETLAAEVGVSEDRVYRILKDLEEFGLVKVIAPTGQAKLLHQSNRYVFPWHQIFDDTDPEPLKATATEPLKTTVGTIRESDTKEIKHAAAKKAAVSADAEMLHLGHFTDLYCHLWRKRYHSKYPWEKKDGPIAAKIWEILTKNGNDPAKVLHNFFAEDDKFYNGHPWTKLRGDLPRFVAGVLSKPTFEMIEDWKDFVKPYVTSIRNAGKSVSGAELSHIMDETWQYTKKVQAGFKIALAEQEKRNKKQEREKGTRSRRPTDVREETIPCLIFPMGLGLTVVYADWIVNEVTSWDKWTGSLDDFHVGRKHWQRFQEFLSQQSDWSFSRDEEEIVRASTPS